MSARFDFSSFRINATKSDRNPKFKNQVSTPKSKNARGGEVIRQLVWGGRVCWIRTQSGNLFIVYIEQTAAGLEWVLMPIKSNAVTMDSADPFVTPLPCSHVSRLPNGYVMEFSDHHVYGAIRNPSAAPLFFKNVKGPKSKLIHINYYMLLTCVRSSGVLKSRRELLGYRHTNRLRWFYFNSEL